MDCTVKQGEPQLVLQLENLLGESGLGDVQPLGCTGNIETVGDLKDIQDLCDCHKHPLPIQNLSVLSYRGVRQESMAYCSFRQAAWASGIRTWIKRTCAPDYRRIRQVPPPGPALRSIVYFMSMTLPL